MLSAIAVSVRTNFCSIWFDWKYHPLSLSHTSYLCYVDIPNTFEGQSLNVLSVMCLPNKVVCVYVLISTWMVSFAFLTWYVYDVANWSCAIPNSPNWRFIQLIVCNNPTIKVISF